MILYALGTPCPLLLYTEVSFVVYAVSKQLLNVNSDTLSSVELRIANEEAQGW